MKKILFIVDNWTIGGREKVIENLIENLSFDNAKIELLIAQKEKPSLKLQPVYSFPKKTKVYNLRKNNIFSLLYFTYLFFLKNHYDIVFTFISPFNLTIIYFIAKLSFSKTKLISSFHGFFSLEKKKIIHYFIRPIEKFVIRKTDFIVTVSEEYKKYLKNQIKISDSKITTIYNPIINKNEILKSKYFPKEFLPFKNNIRLLTVSRINFKDKDFYTLIKSFILIKQKINSAKLFIVGDGPDRNKLEDLIRKNNLEKDIILLGVKEDPYSYYFGADIFLLSSFSEGLPTVVVEAMALECPVVVTDCPIGPRELIGNNENGILVPTQNPEKMAEAVILLIKNQELRQKIIKNAKRKSEEFEIKKSIQKYKDLFDRFLK
jgi:glycosyltransferase involved in cell wall biosynthesis